MIKDSLQLCGLWKRKSEKGEEYFVGSFLGIRVMVFKNKDKKEAKHPDFKIVLAPKVEKESSDNWNEPPFDSKENIPF